MLDHLPDIESDMSAHHRIGDMYEMDGPLFFRRASRLFAYPGAVRARLLGARAEPEGESITQPAHQPDVQVIAPTREAIMSSPLADVISFGQG